MSNTLQKSNVSDGCLSAKEVSVFVLKSVLVSIRQLCSSRVALDVNPAKKSLDWEVLSENDWPCNLCYDKKTEYEHQFFPPDQKWMYENDTFWFFEW